MKKSIVNKFGILAIILTLSFSNINAQTSGGTGSTFPSSRFLVTPNPSTAFAMVIALGEGNNISRIAIFNRLGQKVGDKNYSETNLRVAMVDVSTLSPDLYTISISSTTTTESQALAVNFPLCPPYCP